MLALPFSEQEFFGVFARYNDAVWPAQWLLYGIAVLIVAVVLRDRPSRLAYALLAFLWLWMGFVYHLTFFADINPAARAFGVMFLAQAATLLWFARRRSAAAATTPRRGSAIGKSFVAYALLGYPLIGYLAGHRYPELPTFGAPCPTTIFTLGILLWTVERMPWWLVVVPLTWTVIGTAAAVELSVPQDYGLPVAGLLTLAIVIQRLVTTRHPRPTPSASATRLM